MNLKNLAALALVLTGLAAVGCASESDPESDQDQDARAKRALEEAHAHGGGDVKIQMPVQRVTAGGQVCFSVGTYGCLYDGDKLIRCADGAC